MKLAIATATLIALIISAIQAKANERWFDFVNKSNRTVVAVHVTPAGSADLRNYDLLDDEVVLPSEHIQLEPVGYRGYCWFDIQVEFDNNQVQNIRDVDLCAATKVETYGWTRNRFYHNVVY
jgi:hypothetical protein